MKKKWIHGECQYVVDTSKILKIMKLTWLLLFAALMQVAGANYAQTTKLNLAGKNLTLEEVFEKIEAQSEFSIFYNLQQVDLSKRIDASFEGEVVDKVLASVLEGTDLTYSVNNRLIVVHKKNVETGLAPSIQQSALAGKVTDRSGSGLPGVTVVIKGTTTGTVTDINGNFSLTNVPQTARLIFSFIGMKS